MSPMASFLGAKSTLELQFEVTIDCYWFVLILYCSVFTLVRQEVFPWLAGVIFCALKSVLNQPTQFNRTRRPSPRSGLGLYRDRVRAIDQRSLPGMDPLTVFPRVHLVLPHDVFTALSRLHKLKIRLQHTGWICSMSLAIFLPLDTCRSAWLLTLTLVRCVQDKCHWPRKFVQ